MAIKARLKHKRSDYWSEILNSIAEDELQIRRVEYAKRIESDEPKGELPRRRGLIGPN